MNLQLALQQQLRSADHKTMLHPNQFSQKNDDPTALTQKSNAYHRRFAYLTMATGSRDSQQDRAGLSIVKNVTPNTANELALILNDTIIELGNRLTDQPSGSTISAFIISHNQIISANVGDSRIILICKTNQKVFCQRMTWDHKPNESVETKRIQSAGGDVIQSDTFRLNGILAVSRALGDFSVGPGLCFTPSISWIKTSPNQIHFLLACTDGITDVLHEKDLTKIVSKQFTANHITENIERAAFQLGSPDNKAVLLVPINHSQQENEILVGFVADGHGGTAAADFISENFMNTFLEKMTASSPNQNIMMTHLL